MIFRVVVYSLLFSSVFFSLGGYAQQSLQGDTLLGAGTCLKPAWVHDAYDIDFGSFNANEVVGTNHNNSGAPINGALYSSPGQSLSRYLVVEDLCAVDDWHVDLFAGPLIDQNLFNTITSIDIPASSVRVRNTNGIVYPLENSTANSEVTATIYTNYISLSTPRQMMQRVSGTNGIGGIYGIKPEYRLTIPEYQQVDKYIGTITWTII